jgi:acylphosphatase
MPFLPFNRRRDGPESPRFPMAEVHHETVFFSGHVQGVGFRYTVLQVAREYEVAGFVSNLADGRVELEAEGEPAEVTAFIDAVREKMHGYIRRVERSSHRRPAQFAGFTIK